jgi:glycosyl transferase family 87
MAMNAADADAQHRRGRPKPLDVGLYAEVPLLALGFIVWNTVAKGWKHGWLGDFRIFRAAAHALVHGHSPYVHPTVHLLAGDQRFVYPAPFALLFAPFNLLGPTASSLLYLFLSGAAIVLAVRLLGVTDWRVAGVALIGGGVYDSFVNGAIGPFLVLALAAAWRYRDRPVSGVLLAVAAAAKLFLWPVLLWPIVARRPRVAVTAGATLAAIAGIWALLDLHGLTEYATTLRILDHLEAPQSYSPEAFAFAVGAPSWLAHLLPAVAAAAGVVWLFRQRDDRRILSGAVFIALLATPILWLHYLALLVVPLALAYPRLSPAWALPVLLWGVGTPESSGSIWKIVFALTVTVVTAVAVNRSLKRSADPIPMPRQDPARQERSDVALPLVSHQ